MNRPQARAYSLTRIFAVPLGLGVLSAIGLVSALVGDGAWDVAAWLTLGAPPIVLAWYLFRTRQTVRR